MPEPVIHQLPDSAALDNQGDHVRVAGPKEDIKITQSKIKLRVTPGTLDADGNFVEHPWAPEMEGWIRDRDTFEEGATDHPAPETRADPFDHGITDVLAFLNEQHPKDNYHGWSVRG